MLKHSLSFLSLTILSLILACCSYSSSNEPDKYRVLISTDIGGTDPDDNQSMAHLLMYSNEFDLEGLVSSPSAGVGSKEQILKMISLYEKDYEQYLSISKDYPSADYLRSITCQGRQSEAPMCGYGEPTEGSEWIVKCARKKDSRPLWILAWGMLEDVAQALHDAPDIAQKIRIYWIGGPNKKWGANAYNFIVKNFPDLWFIECNASYRGFIGSNSDGSEYQNGFWNRHMEGHGLLADTFVEYYGGTAKMGDTPSLLYLLGTALGKGDFDPNVPEGEHWGGSFDKMSQSPKYIITGPLAECDTVPVYSIMEWRLEGPEKDIPADSVAITLIVDNQTWKGHYTGDGIYSVRYAPKAPATLSYTITSNIDGLEGHCGTFVVGDKYPAVGKYSTSSPSITSIPITVGSTWWTDRSDPDLESGESDYEDYLDQRSHWQGAGSVAKYREQVMKDWAKRMEQINSNN